MKKLIFGLFLFSLFFTFIVASAENYDFYYELIGKSKEYIKSNFPNAETLSIFSEIFPGYTELFALQFDNGGFLSVLVSYNKKGEVKSVAMAMFDVIETNNPNVIYEALNYFSYFYGFQTRGNINKESIKVTEENDVNISMIISDEIEYIVKRRYKNFKQYFLAEAEYIGN